MQSLDYETRKSSITGMIGKFKKEDIVLLQELKKQEEEKSILDVIEFAIALHEVKYSEVLDVRIKALAKISGRLSPAVKYIMISFLLKYLYINHEGLQIF